MPPTKAASWTIGQAAVALKVQPRTIAELADKGLLPYELTAGGHRRFLPEDVSARAKLARDLESVRRRRASLLTSVPPARTTAGAK